MFGALTLVSSTQIGGLRRMRKDWISIFAPFLKGHACVSVKSQYSELRVMFVRP